GRRRAGITPAGRTDVTRDNRPHVAGRARWLLLGLLVLGAPGAAAAENLLQYFILPEQRTIQVRDPAQLPPTPVPRVPPPRTVTDPTPRTRSGNSRPTTPST